MEVMAELNTEFFDDSAPAVGPGGLVNLSRVSRDLSKGQSTKDEALRALPPPPPPPQKKRSDLYGPGVGAGPGRATPTTPLPRRATRQRRQGARGDAREEDARGRAEDAAGARAARRARGRGPAGRRRRGRRQGRGRVRRARRRSSSSPRTSTRRSGAAAASRPSRRPAASLTSQRCGATATTPLASGRVASAATRALDGAARLGALAVGAGRRGHALARDRAPAALVAVATVRRLAPLASGRRAASRGLPPRRRRAAGRRRRRGPRRPRRAGGAGAGASGLVAAYAASRASGASPGPTRRPLLALAWLSKPDVDGLRRRLDPDRAGPGPPLAARLRRRGRLRAAAGGLEDRRPYLGVFGTWFACRDAGVAARLTPT
ncbi:hypothetical protein SO694_00057147 [Aureococcus anophagefferens]|uniref:Uncharacterized protein n=1 Tax=Aureococcus anophagefferens TaxID=44056 RepID=A0ABR1FX43_AURAN